MSPEQLVKAAIWAVVGIVIVHVPGSIHRMEGYLDESEGSGRPETMVREALWEPSTSLTQVAVDLSTGPRGG